MFQNVQQNFLFFIMLIRIIVQNCRRFSSKKTPFNVARKQSDAFEIYEIISSNIPVKAKASIIEGIINDKQSTINDKQSTINDKQSTIEKNELNHAKVQTAKDDLILELNSKYEKEAFARAFLEKSLSVRKLIGKCNLT